MNDVVCDHQLLLDSLSTAVLLVDDKLNIEYINSSAEHLFATSSPRICGHSVLQFFGEAEERLQALNDALGTGNPFTERKATLILADQSRTVVDFTVSPLFEGSQRRLVIEVLPMARIIRIDREQALLSAHDTSRNLIRGLAHEIKNPLGGIRGAAQLLAEEISSEDVSEYIEVISSEVDRLCELVDNMLGPRKPLKFSRMNLHEVTEHVATLVAAETGGKLSIVRDYDPSIPEIQGNREQLIQAVLNIVRNSMQALQDMDDLERGQLILRTRIQRHITIGQINHRVVARLDIIDNGPGIPAEIFDRIFYPMISGRLEGSGLGLPIAQSAINRHDGLIECESEPGNTQFSIYLPIDNHYE